MSKQEFLDILQKNLASIHDYAFIKDTVSYYENYIDGHIRMGKTMEEVMEELGDPRLIAKSIRATYEPVPNEKNAYEREEYGKETHASRRIFRIRDREFQLPLWLVKMARVLMIGVVLFLVFTVLRWLSPFIFTGLIVYLVFRALSGKY